MATTGTPLLDRRRGLAWLAVLAPLLAACGCSERAPGPNDVIRVAAASDLQTALPEIIQRFERDSGAKVEPTFGASGKLAEQIRAGARFDLFLAANEAFVRTLASEHLIQADSVRPYATGTLVLAVRADAAEPVASLADLKKPGVKKIALANPETAPYGSAARQVLRKAGLWKELGPKLVLADSVRQAFLFVETGNADVAFVGRALTKGTAVGVVAVDPGLHDPIVQSLGLVLPVHGGSNPEAFAAFLTGPKGRAILKSFGFDPPPSASP